jgi:hypothetical protein
MAALNKAMGIPRSSTAQISEIVPPTFVIGADEAIPAIYDMSVVNAKTAQGRLTNLPARMVPWANAEGSVKIK